MSDHAPADNAENGATAAPRPTGAFAGLDLGLGRRTPVLLQTEVAECGLACLAMVAGHHGHRVDLATLRQRHAVSLKGSSLTDLMRLAGALDLRPRPLKLPLAQLRQLPLPCVLHWDFNHYVVLAGWQGARAVVHDPAQGRRVLGPDEIDPHFTGVALELQPTAAFRPRRERQRVPLGRLLRGDGPAPRLLGGAGHAASAPTADGTEGDGAAGLGAAAAPLWRPLAQVLALALALQVFALAAPFHLQWLVDQALVAQDHGLVTVLGLGFVLLAVVQAATQALRAWLLMVLGTLVNLQLQTNLFGHLVRLPMAWFAKRHTGDVLSKFGSLAQIQRTLTGSLLEALIDGVMALATLAMMLLYSPALAALALAAAGLYAGLRVALHRPLRQATEQHLALAARQHSHFLESVRAMQGIKLFGREDLRQAGWQNLLVDEFNAGIRVERLGLGFRTLNGLLFGVEGALTLWLGGLLVLGPAADGAGGLAAAASAGGSFTVGMLLAFLAYKTQFVQRVAALVDNALQLRLLGLHAERVGDIVLTAPEPQDDAWAAWPDAAPTGERPSPPQLRLQAVSFRYGDADPLVLDGLDLEIAPGESVAIVGPSGGGKTTLVRLLLGLLAPSSGQVLVDGQPLATHGLARWRQRVACVMQDDQLLAGSIADNICFFEPQPDARRIAECAQLAAVHEDIVAMPMLYNTLVGDMGTVLSGGQKQRILLARALYRQPQVLVLDEATSHLDIARERAVNEAVRALPLTRIIVAHRPETIASADRVVVLAGGRVQQALRTAARSA